MRNSINHFGNKLGEWRLVWCKHRLSTTPHTTVASKLVPSRILLLPSHQAWRKASTIGSVPTHAMLCGPHQGTTCLASSQRCNAWYKNVELAGVIYRDGWTGPVKWTMTSPQKHPDGTPGYGCTVLLTDSPVVFQTAAHQNTTHHPQKVLENWNCVTTWLRLTRVIN